MGHRSCKSAYRRLTASWWLPFDGSAGEASLLRAK
jgi:hypothetical protein